jgi:hypothetical protein
MYSTTKSVDVSNQLNGKTLTVTFRGNGSPTFITTFAETERQALERFLLGLSKRFKLPEQHYHNTTFFHCVSQFILFLHSTLFF